MYPSIRLGIALVLLLLTLIVAACSAVGSLGSSAGPSRSLEPVRATDVEGPFELSFVLPRSNWRSGESIEGEARLWLTNERAAKLYGSGGGLLAFAFREVDGARNVGPVMQGDCAPHPIGPAAPIVSPIVKSGAWSDTDPHADFVRAFLEGPEVRLPAGVWDIVVTAQFDDGDTCTAAPLSLEASVRVRVVD